MARFAVVFALLASFCLEGCLAETRLEVALSHAMVSPGDDVTVECRVHGYQPGLFINWWKKQDSDEVRIGNSAILESAYAGRYETVPVLVDENDVVIFAVSIRGVIAEDSGEFGCSVPTIEGSKVYGTLMVTAPVREIHLYAMASGETGDQPVREFANGEEVPFDENAPYYFQCTASGSYPAPTIDLALGHAAEFENINHKFMREERMQLEDTVGQAALKRYSSSATMTTIEPVSITTNIEGMELRCEASVSGHETLSIHIVPVLRLPPRIDCTEVVRTVIYQSAVEIACTVHADPPVDRMVWYWARHSGANATLHPGQADSHYKFTVEQGKAPGSKVAKLLIDKAFKQTFRDYHLIVGNSIGSVHHRVSFQRDLALEAISGTTSNVLSVAAMMAVGMTTLVLSYLDI